MAEQRLKASGVTGQLVDGDWVGFRGGELEGKRPKALCPACRDQLARLVREGRARQPQPQPRAPIPEPRPLCFQCYRAELDRQRALQAAGQLDTSSAERFQDGLPFEPVNRARLERLKSERGEARLALRTGVGRYIDRRRQAQIAARHALQRIVAGLQSRSEASERTRLFAAAIHSAELQLPESWVPFVCDRA
jgi:hypothetical protein